MGLWNQSQHGKHVEGGGYVHGAFTLAVREALSVLSGDIPEAAHDICRKT